MTLQTAAVWRHVFSRLAFATHLNERRGAVSQPRSLSRGGERMLSTPAPMSFLMLTCCLRISVSDSGTVHPMPSYAFGCSLLASPRDGLRAWQSATSIDDICDDALTIILTSLPAEDARAAFCTSSRWAGRAAAAREMRLKLYWRALFRSDIGFPEDVSLLTAADVVRFESRLINARIALRASNPRLCRTSLALC